MGLACLTFNPYHYSHSSFPPSVSASFPLSLHSPLPLWVSYIYFSEVFLIWHGSRPGRFSPWLQLLSQLLSPAGAALCWVLSSIWGPVSMCVCASVCECVCSIHDFVFMELGARKPDRCLFNSPHWHRPPKVSCPSTSDSDGTEAALSVIRSSPVPVICIPSLALKLTLITCRPLPFFTALHFWVKQRGGWTLNMATMLIRTLSRCFHSSAHSRSVRRWSITSSWRVPCTAKRQTHRSLSDSPHYTVYREILYESRVHTYIYILYIEKLGVWWRKTEKFHHCSSFSTFTYNDRGDVFSFFVPAFLEQTAIFQKVSVVLYLVIVQACLVPCLQFYFLAFYKSYSCSMHRLYKHCVTKTRL